MKNFVKTLLLVFITLFVISCKKSKNDDPTPVTPTTNETTLTVSTTGTLIAPANIDLVAVVTDGDGVSKVEVLDGTTVIASMTAKPFTYTLTALVAGTYTYTVKSTDNLGNTKTFDVTFVVVNTNSAPVFTGSDLGTVTSGTIIADKTLYTVTNLNTVVSDPENGTLTVTNVTTGTSGVTFGGFGTNFDINIPNSLLTNQLTLSVTVSDGVNSTTGSVTLTVDNTYGTLSSFFGNVLNDELPVLQSLSLKINSDGTISSNSSNGLTTSFWGDNTSTYGTWTIDSSGDLVIDGNGSATPVTYTVSTSDASGNTWLKLGSIECGY